MHPLARPAAGLSVLAAQNGRFWTVYAALFQATPRLSPDAVREAARQAGLDWDHLSPTLDSPEVSQRIDADIALGKSVGVEGTPTLFVNGRQYHGAIDSANLERVVLAQLGRPELSRTELSRKSGGGTQR
jgi:protein-disulfide isomerase